MSSDSGKDGVWEVVRSSLNNLEDSVQSLNERQENISENQKDISEKVEELEGNQERLSSNQYRLSQRVEDLSGVRRREVVGAVLAAGGFAWLYTSTPESPELGELGSFEEDSYDLTLRDGGAIEELARMYRHSEETGLREVGDYLENRFSAYDPGKAHLLGWDDDKTSVEYGFGNSLKEVFELDDASYNRSLELLDRVKDS